MKLISFKLKPAIGLSYVVHLCLRVLLPLILFILVRLNFIQLAFILILLSKWRMFAVRPRFWPANIRANSIDIIVGFAAILLMMHSPNMIWQLVWAIAYAVWLTTIKPASSILMTSVQAAIGFVAGLSAIFHMIAGAPLFELVLLTGLVCYLAARHFFDSFDEPYAKFLAFLWGYFGAALVWLLGHWLLYYGIVSQPSLLLDLIGIGLATLYYLDHFDRLSNMVKRQIVFIMTAVVVIVVFAPTNWQGKIF